MSYIVLVVDPDMGSSTSIGADTREEALTAVIEWLGGSIQWLEETE